MLPTRKFLGISLMFVNETYYTRPMDRFLRFTLLLLFVPCVFGHCTETAECGQGACVEGFCECEEFYEVISPQVKILKGEYCELFWKDSRQGWYSFFLFYRWFVALQNLILFAFARTFKEAIDAITLFSVSNHYDFLLWQSTRNQHKNFRNILCIWTAVPEFS